MHMAASTSTKVRVSGDLPTDLFSPARAWRPSLLIVLGYGAITTLWIVFSDRLVGAFTSDPATITRLQTVKGWAFVTISSVALFFLIQKTIRSIQHVSARGAETAEMLRRIVENSPLGIVVVDEDGHYVRANKAFADLLGYPMERLVGMNFRDVTVPEDIDPSAQLYQELRQGADLPVTLEKRYVRADGTTMWAHLSAARLGPEVPGYAIAIVKDITARKVREQELQRTLEALTASNHQRELLLDALLAAEESERQRIAADIHDDSLQVLTSALMNLDVFQRPDVSDERRAETLRATRVHLASAMRRLRSLVFDLRPALLDEEGLVAALDRFLAEAASDRTGFSHAVEDRLATDIPADMAMVAYRIGREAITNALKHSRATRLEVTVGGQRDLLTLVVSDDGVGFDVAGLPTADRHHHGVRLMRERTEAVGGTFAIVSAPNEGTTVTVELPLAQPISESQLRLDTAWEREAG